MNDKKVQNLIKKIQKRHDRRAADELIRLYYKEIYVYVFKQVSVKENAMDVTQDIFLGMLQTIWNYDSDKSSFRTWLYRIATYKVVDYYRSKRTGECSDELLFEMASEDDLESDYIKREEIQQIFDFLRRRERILEELFRLKFYGNYTFDEIGQILNLPSSTVKTKYYTALKSVRNELSVERRRK